MIMHYSRALISSQSPHLYRKDQILVGRNHLILEGLTILILSRYNLVYFIFFALYMKSLESLKGKLSIL